MSRSGYSSGVSGRPRIKRQGNSADLRDIGSRIEDRRSDRAWQRDGQLAPISGPRVAQLLERGAKHVFDDVETTGGREDEPLGGDGAVADVGRGIRAAPRRPRPVDGPGSEPR